MRVIISSHCDISGGKVLGQRREKILHPIYCASISINSAQKKNTTTKRELLFVIFVFEIFCSYLSGTVVLVHTNHLVLSYLIEKRGCKTTDC